MKASRTIAALVLASAAACAAAEANGFRTVKDIPYYPDDILSQADALKKERCRLDVRIPEGFTNFPVVVWYHGGGLVHGKRGGYCQISRNPANGIGGVSVGYRFVSEVTPADTIGDAAAAQAATEASTNAAIIRLTFM